MTIQLTDFKDLSKLTTWVKRLSYIGILASIFALYAGTWEYEYLQGMLKGSYLTEDLATEAENISDKWVGTAGIFQSFILFHVVAFFIWIYRMNYNTRALRSVTVAGGADMKFTPAWSVGWFFIPIANLWKPYQVLKELWNFNHALEASELDRKKFSFIKWFWAFSLISSILGQKVMVKSLFAKDLAQLIQANKLTFVSDFADIPYYFMTVILVERIYRLQMERFAPQAHQYQQLIREMPFSEEAQKKLTKSKRVKRFMLSLLAIWLVVLVLMLLFIWFEHLINLN